MWKLELDLLDWSSSAGPIPSCICPAGYTGDGYGLNGCLALSTICQNQNPCGNGQCLVSFWYCVCNSDLSWSLLKCGTASCGEGCWVLQTPQHPVPVKPFLVVRATQRRYFFLLPEMAPNVRKRGWLIPSKTLPSTLKWMNNMKNYGLDATVPFFQRKESFQWRKTSIRGKEHLHPTPY